MKKKILVLIAVVILALGIRLRGSGLMRLDVEGTFTVFEKDSQITMDISKLPTLNRWNSTVRLDFYGGKKAMEKVIESLNGKILWVEEVDGMEILYLSSVLVEQSTIVHGEEVNIMICLNGDKVVLGAPIIKGSY